MHTANRPLARSLKATAYALTTSKSHRLIDSEPLTKNNTTLARSVYRLRSPPFNRVVAGQKYLQSNATAHRPREQITSVNTLSGLRENPLRLTRRHLLTLHENLQS
ncbi:MAG: hypothetical protein [Microviridae sp. ctbuH30]|nr:MAG: hypothetical protein [Microviridae sp. ctbuH30]